jgi:hypothetical protein
MQVTCIKFPSGGDVKLLTIEVENGIYSGAVADQVGNVTASSRAYVTVRTDAKKF